MTKKIKDFTIGEIMEICKKYFQNRCKNCPFDNCCLVTGVIEEKYLEQEIEVEE